MDLGIAGKRALVLGGNRGIGFGVARALANEGVHVAIAARDAARLGEAARELKASTDVEVHTASIDLSRVDMLPAFAEELTARFGTIISETVAANKGIGYLMMAATANFDTPLVFAGLIVIAIMGIAMYALFAVVEQRMTFWAKRGDGLMT